MYLSSGTELLRGQQENAARKAACSDARVLEARRMMAEGRARSFRTIVSPSQVAERIGIPAAVNVQKLQDESLDSRAALLSNGLEPPHPDGPSLGELIADAPEVISLNAQADQTGCSNVVFSQRPAPKNVRPGMPRRAPEIVATDFGPMYFKGADHPTYRAASSMGLTGYAPSWSDAWVMRDTQLIPSQDMGVLGWIQAHPWLSLALGAVAVYGVSQSGKRGRR